MPKVKPSKPHKDFPLFAHPNGQWAKKVRGVPRYFGLWANPEAALQKWLAEKDDLLAGRSPAIRGGSRCDTALNLFLTAKRRLVDQGLLSLTTWHQYKGMCDLIIRTWGKGADLNAVGPADFMRLRDAMAKGLKLTTWGPRLIRLKVVFKWIADSELVDRPFRYGPEFKRPSISTLRRAKAAAPQRSFTAAEIRQQIAATQRGNRRQLQAMILLGINCGFGNLDCSELREKHIDLDKAIIDFPRPKTGVDRRCPLWPETVKALRDVLEHRRPAADKADADRLFLDTAGGPCVQNDEYDRRGRPQMKHVDHIAYIYKVVLKEVGCYRQGVGFYALRHVFETVAGMTGVQPAVDRIMGHEDANMSTVYREWQRTGEHDAHLRKVTDYVRNWYLGQ